LVINGVAGVVVVSVPSVVVISLVINGVAGVVVVSVPSVVVISFVINGVAGVIVVSVPSVPSIVVTSFVINGVETVAKEVNPSVPAVVWIPPMVVTSCVDETGDVVCSVDIADEGISGCTAVVVAVSSSNEHLISFEYPTENDKGRSGYILHKIIYSVTF
jgi:hypothetical protein